VERERGGRHDHLPLFCVVARSGQEPIVVNLDITGVDVPEEVSRPHRLTSSA
jgi:hypothetical protein